MADACPACESLNKDLEGLQERIATAIEHVSHLAKKHGDVFAWDYVEETLENAWGRAVPWEMDEDEMQEEARRDWTITDEIGARKRCSYCGASFKG